MKRIVAGVFTVVLVGAAVAQFPPPYNSELEKTAPLPAVEAAARFKAPPGFRVTVFASEPEVQNPIACCWDARGRLWVAENYTYAERGKKFDLNLRDRIVILTDRGVGQPPGRDVFCDDLQMLTGIEVEADAVWVMCPPRLLRIPMRGDRPAGPPEVVLDGFTVPPENYHNFANGLKWGPDGWLYGRCGASAPGEVGVPGTPPAERVPLRGGVWRFSPRTKVFEALCHGTTNPWGHDWDEFGECFFINTVNGHLWHMIPGAHYVRPHTIDPNPHVYRLIDQHADHWHWDTRKDWSDSRKTTPEHDARGGGHAHVGMMIYHGTQWPEEYRGKLFTLNFHGRRVNVERLDRRGSGYVGRHEPDILFAADPFFRGQEITTGPDGDVFILDWSDTGECHEHTGVHRTSGRIFRVRYGDQPGTARHRARGPEWDHLAIRGSGTTLTPRHREAMAVFALRRRFDDQPLDTVLGPQPHAKYTSTDADVRFLIEAAGEPAGLMRLAVASTLQRLPVERRAEVARALVSNEQDAHDHNLPLLVWYGLIPVGRHHPEHLVRVMEACTWPLTRICISRRLAEDIATRPKPLDDVLTLALARPPEFAADVVRGMIEGLRGWQRAPRPAAWDAFAAKFPSDGVRDLSVLFGDGRALEQVKAIALNGQEPLDARKAALRSLIAARPADLRATCESLLKERFLNSVAVKGLALFDDPAIAALTIKHWGAFHPSERGIAVDALVSRASFAGPLLDAIASGKIGRAELNAAQARQIASFNDAKLNARLEQVWGRVKESPAEKKQAIARWKEKLDSRTLEAGDLARGRALFDAHCASCHKLYDAGGSIGPELTGAGRDNLDYLLENILDPAAVVTADFRATRVALTDGRVLIGIVTSRTGDALTLQMEKEQVTVRTDDIDHAEVSELSLMPEGLLNNLSDEQVRDLFAYLMGRRQVAPAK